MLQRLCLQILSACVNIELLTLLPLELLLRGSVSMFRTSVYFYNGTGHVFLLDVTACGLSVEQKFKTSLHLSN